MQMKSGYRRRYCRRIAHSHFGRSVRATVILHTDHCAKKLLPWIDGLLDASEKHFASTGKPLFSSHMIDLSEEPIERISKFAKGI
jgi:fructose/tagatose bisphosphate aldolase